MMNILEFLGFGPRDGGLIHAKADAGNLRFARCLVFSFWIIYLAIFPVQQAGELPLEVTNPVGFLAVLPVSARAFIFNVQTLLVMRLACMALCFLCIWRHRALVWVGLPLCAMLLTIQGVLRSFGSVNHGEVVPLLAALTLTLCAILDAVFARGKFSAAPPLILICTATTVAYCMVAIYRYASDPGVLFDDSIVMWSYQSTIKDNFFPPGIGHLGVEYGWFGFVLVVGYFMTTLMELLSPLALYNRRFRYVWLAYMAIFHVGTFFTMRIFFWENLMMYLMFFEGLKLRADGQLEGLRWPLRRRKSALVSASLA